MRADRHRKKLFRFRNRIVCMGVVGTIAGAVTYGVMSGAFEAVQPEMPYSWMLATISAIELIGGIWIGWFFSNEHNRHREGRWIKTVR